MDTNLIESRAKLGLHLEGESEIEANLLARTISDFATLIKETSNKENPQAYLKMNVTAFKDGSFEILFSTVGLVALTLLHNPQYALTIINIVKGYFEIKQLLKGGAPKSVEKVEEKKIKVTAPNGKFVVVDEASGNVINNTFIDNLTVNVAQDIREHTGQGGFTLKTPQGDLHCTSSDVAEIGKPLPIEEITSWESIQERTPLHIKKPDLIGRSAWDFKYKGRIITARVEDEEWLDKINNGILPIRAGDYIDATLVVFVEVNEDGSHIQDTEKYTVTKIHGNIHHDEVEQTDFTEHF